MADYVVFDVETKHSFDDVGGRDHLHKLEISVAVMYDSRLDVCHVFRERDLPQLVQRLREADRVIGFNLFGFDYPVLQAYTEFKLDALPTLDLMKSIQQTLNRRVSLDNLCRATLNAPKSGDGLKAIEWYRNGDWDRLIRYCEKDVLLTRDLYRFGVEHGYVKFWDGDRRAERQVPVTWTET